MSRRGPAPLGDSHDRSIRAVSADLRVVPDLRTGSARRRAHFGELELCCQDLDRRFARGTVAVTDSRHLLHTGEEVLPSAGLSSSVSLFSAAIRKVQRACTGSDKTGRYKTVQATSQAVATALPATLLRAPAIYCIKQTPARSSRDARALLGRRLDPSRISLGQARAEQGCRRSPDIQNGWSAE